jgi:cytochrome c oxidase subunit 2
MDGVQSMLDPAGPHAARIAGLWWALLVTATVVFVLVMAALAWAVVRGRRARRELAGETPAVGGGAEDRRLAGAVVMAVAATAVVLLAFLVTSVRTGRLHAEPPGSDALLVEIVGRQWWWEIRYLDSVPSRIVTTANELRIPVGRPVRLRLLSRDVIHSLWVPNLAGKRDLITGNPTETWLRADSAGSWRGQCAEFCGHQHARMGLWVVAEPPEDFTAWYEAQLAPAAPPRDSLARRGEEVFLGGSCVLCHKVAGTRAGSGVGPDLTHFASRIALGAATRPNVRGHLAGWISDPQGIKPGARMPANPLPPADLEALLHYLEGLR